MPFPPESTYYIPCSEMCANCAKSWAQSSEVISLQLTHISKVKIRIILQHRMCAVIWYPNPFFSFLFFS